MVVAAVVVVVVVRISVDIVDVSVVTFYITSFAAIIHPIITVPVVGVILTVMVVDTCLAGPITLTQGVSHSVKELLPKNCRYSAALYIRPSRESVQTETQGVERLTGIEEVGRRAGLVTWW